MSNSTRGRQPLGGEEQDKTIRDLRAALIAKDNEISRLKVQVKAKQGDKNIERRRKLDYFHGKKALSKENQALRAADKEQKGKLKKATDNQKELQTRIDELEVRLTGLVSSPGNARDQLFSEITERRPSRAVMVEPASAQLGGTQDPTEHKSVAPDLSYSALKAMYDGLKAMSEKSETKSKATLKANEELKSQLETIGLKLKNSQDGIQAMEEKLSRLETVNENHRIATQKLRPSHERLIKLESKLLELIHEFNISPAVKAEGLN